jgi:histidinol-phosphate phosphatase family protein
MDFGKHLFPAMLAAGTHLYGYVSTEYIKDAGTPDRLDKVTADYYSGRIARGSYATPAPAVFLDRDGTLNREANRVKTVEGLEILPGVPQAVALLNRSDYRAIVITNQPVVARGDCDEHGLQRIHDKLETLLGMEGAYLDGIYYCPHHPDKGFPGERPELKIRCNCRKPGTGLIKQATSDLNLDLSRSWMIGDSPVDVRTAAAAGVRSIRVRTGHDRVDDPNPVNADYEFETLLDAVRFILTDGPPGAPPEVHSR